MHAPDVPAEQLNAHRCVRPALREADQVELAGEARLREHLFDDESGPSHAIFRRALDRRNLPSAWAAAAELQVVSLGDALALCLLVRDREPAKFTRLALPWHARFCAGTPDVDLETGRLVLDLLTAIGRIKAIPVARALRELIGSYDTSLAEPLRRWEIEHAANR